ncbi:NDR1/HIN1 protein [Trifolium repens]|nr:NDR1/HIN1 protein [Trifolium repens]
MAMNCAAICEWIRVILVIGFGVTVFSFLIAMTIITYLPTNLEFHVTEASLSKFNLTNNNTLSYKLEAKITSRNPNKHVEVYFRKVTAIARYKGHNFTSVDLTPFDQGHKNTTVLNVVFQGKGFIKLKPKQLFEYNEETGLGVYNDLAIDFDFLIRYKLGRYKSGRFNTPLIQCRRLSLSLISNGNSSPPSPSFHGSKCRIKSGRFFDSR